VARCRRTRRLLVPAPATERVGCESGGGGGGEKVGRGWRRDAGEGRAGGGGGVTEVRVWVEGGGGVGVLGEERGGGRGCS
jgi:hypothetical protein